MPLGAGAATGATTASARVGVVQARPADSLADTFGVVVHLGYDDTPYANIDEVDRAVRELGVRHLRTRLVVRNPGMYSAMRRIASDGARFDLVLGNPTSPATPLDLVNTIASAIPNDVVESVEGANEWDLSGRSGWATELRNHQQALYQAVKGNPATADLPVLAPALGGRDTFAAAGDLSAWSDVANAHLYTGGLPPSTSIDAMTAAVREVAGADKPVIFTETGYHNAMSSTTTHYPTPESVAKIYAPRLLLEHYLRGTMRMYDYELFDQYADPGLTDRESNFGLVRNDGTRKGSFKALRNLLALVDDRGPSFSPGELSYSLSNTPADLRQVLLQKRDGSFVLLLWRDVSVYDRKTEQRLAVTSTKVGVTLADRSTITVYKPSGKRAGAVSQTVGTATSVGLAGQVVALHIEPRRRSRS